MFTDDALAVKIIDFQTVMNEVGGGMTHWWWENYMPVEVPEPGLPMFCFNHVLKQKT